LSDILNELEAKHRIDEIPAWKHDPYLTHSNLTDLLHSPRRSGGGKWEYRDAGCGDSC
jgi:hypothetical protein